MSSSEEHAQRVGVPVPDWTPRRRPDPGPFEGRFCRVVPLRAAHAEPMFASCAGPGNEALWTYLHDGPYARPGEFGARVERTVADPATVSVAITGPDGVPGGLADYMRIDEANGAVEVGGILLGTSLQRTTAATEAMYLMARHVFDDLGYRRYEWKCDALNARSRAAAERLGFRFEGTFRNAVVTKGRNRDTAWYAMTDEDWYGVAAAFELWLVPANFDADGGQRVRLGALTSPENETSVPYLGTPGRLA